MSVYNTFRHWSVYIEFIEHKVTFNFYSKPNIHISLRFIINKVLTIHITIIPFAITRIYKPTSFIFSNVKTSIYLLPLHLKNTPNTRNKTFILIKKEGINSKTFLRKIPTLTLLLSIFRVHAIWKQPHPELLKR